MDCCGGGGGVDRFSAEPFVREREGYENDRWGPCKGETEPSFPHVDT
jgi:hypothetical protein